jgi:DNA-binding Xre family transcriptional regulator
MVMIQPVPIKWKLKNVLEKHDIKARDLAREIEKLGGKTREVTLYRITGRKSQIMPKGLDVLEDVISGLNSITGETFTPNDLLEYQTSEVVQDA